MSDDVSSSLCVQFILQFILLYLIQIRLRRIIYSKIMQHRKEKIMFQIYPKFK